MRKAIIGITADVEGDRLCLNRSYGRMVGAAGGVPVVLPPEPGCVEAYIGLCDGLILSGGDDPVMEPFGVPTHPRAKPIDPDRQAFELALLERLAARPEKPVLGICLGMQLMALHAGGGLDQHLPETLATAGLHWGRTEHEITGPLGSGSVLSHHRQAVTDPGSLRTVAESPDGVIEAVRDESRPFYLGVQWHPERTDDDALGAALFGRLVSAATSAIL